MNRRGLLLSAAAGAMALQAQAPPPGKTHLKKGDKAPNFSLRSTMGDPRTPVTLAEHLGKSSVVLAFFPAAFTGG